MIFDIEQGKESLANRESVEGSDQREGITGMGGHDLQKAWITSEQRRNTLSKNK